MYCTCYITDLCSHKSFFDNIEFEDYDDIYNFIALMEDNDFCIDRIVNSEDIIIYDTLEVY